MKEPIILKSDYDWTYEVSKDGIKLFDKNRKLRVTFVGDCEHIEQAIWIFRNLKEQEQNNEK